MTRKARKSRKIKSRRQRYKIKGGAFLAAGLAKKVGSKLGSLKERIPGLRALQPNPNELVDKEKKGTDLHDVFQVLKFSLGAIIMSPLYIGTVLANLPLNTIHNLSGKKINEKHSDAVGIQLYKYMFEGYKLEPEPLSDKLQDKDRFLVKQGVTVKKNTIAKCDNCQTGGGVQRGGYMNTFKTFDEIMGFKPFNGIKGVLGEMRIEKYKEEITKNVAYQRKQILHKLRELEFEVDSIKEDFITRKPILKENIKNLRTEILFKCIVVCETLIKECVESKDNKVVTVNKDMVVVSNPYRRKDKDSSHFKMEVCFLHDNCKSQCPNCTLFDNMISVYHSYARILLNTLRGKNNNLYVVIDLLFTILKNALGKKKPEDKPIIELDKFESMKYKGTPDEIQAILDNLKAPNTTTDPETKDPIVMFRQLICDYGIYDEIKKVFKERVEKVKSDNEQTELLLNKLNSII